jgi:hypothetical protein
VSTINGTTTSATGKLANGPANTTISIISNTTMLTTALAGIDETQTMTDLDKAGTKVIITGCIAAFLATLAFITSTRYTFCTPDAGKMI